VVYTTPFATTGEVVLRIPPTPSRHFSFSRRTSPALSSFSALSYPSWLAWSWYCGQLAPSAGTVKVSEAVRLVVQPRAHSRYLVPGLTQAGTPMVTGPNRPARVARVTAIRVLPKNTLTFSDPPNPPPLTLTGTVAVPDERDSDRLACGPVWLAIRIPAPAAGTDSASEVVTATASMSHGRGRRKAGTAGIYCGAAGPASKSSGLRPEQAVLGGQVQEGRRAPERIADGYAGEPGLVLPVPGHLPFLPAGRQAGQHGFG
jgi:hypothetical protein